MVFKVFEDIVLRRPQVDILKRINKQQGGASYMLYVAFMDGKKVLIVYDMVVCCIRRLTNVILTQRLLWRTELCIQV